MARLPFQLPRVCRTVSKELSALHANGADVPALLLTGGEAKVLVEQTSGFRGRISALGADIHFCGNRLAFKRDIVVRWSFSGWGWRLRLLRRRAGLRLGRGARCRRVVAALVAGHRPQLAAKLLLQRLRLGLADRRRAGRAVVAFDEGNTKPRLVFVRIRFNIHLNVGRLPCVLGDRRYVAVPSGVQDQSLALRVVQLAVLFDDPQLPTNYKLVFAPVVPLALVKDVVDSDLDVDRDGP